MDLKGNKGFRLLSIYERLNKGEVLSKDLLSKEFCVSHKTIQRDITDLRLYLYEIHPFEIDTLIQYDKLENVYSLKRSDTDWLTNEEILIISMILLKSNSLERKQMLKLIDKLIKHSTYSDGNYIRNIINIEYDNYDSPNGNKSLLTIIWRLLEHIENREIIEFSYIGKEKMIKKHVVKPVTIIFNKPYFYLISYEENNKKDIPIAFIISSITGVEKVGDKFRIPYSTRINSKDFKGLIK